MKIGGVYILSRRSIARVLATITAALVMFCDVATAQAKDTVRRIHSAAISLHSIDLQMVGRTVSTIVPDFMYQEYKSLYLELKPSVAARSVIAPYQTAAAPRRRNSRRGSGLKGKRTERMVEQLAEFTAWLRGNPINEREGLVRLHTDIGVICGVITGSFPTADAAFDATRNSLELALRLDDAIRLDLSDTVPVIVTDEDVTKLRVDNAMDLVEERPMNLIHGQHVFRVAGFNMVLSDEGAAAYLEDARPPSE